MLSWNCRGLNDPFKVLEVKQLVSMYEAKMVCLIETRVKVGNVGKVRGKLQVNGVGWLIICFLIKEDCR